jgi:endonuclease YncB( thermonuclease family)
MSREIRGIRKLVNSSDGDTIHLDSFQMFRNGAPFGYEFPPASKTSKGYLKIRLLGIDSPELHYNGPVKAPCENPLKGAARPKIPQQETWATTAKEWIDAQLPDGAQVIVELDGEVLDQYKRVLGHVWSVKGDWEKDQLLNVEMVRAGLAFPYQLWPNLSHYGEVKEAVKEAIADKRFVHKALAKSILKLSSVAGRRKINEPFLYRKAVDAAICQVAPQTLLTRFIGNAKTWEYYPPKKYQKVPIEYRIFLANENEAKKAGFTKA